MNMYLIAWHILAFIASIALIFYYMDHTVASMLLPELTALYVALANLKRKELLPPLAIIIVFKIIEFPLSLAAFSSIEFYLMNNITFDALLIICLQNYHNSDKLRQIFNVSEPIERRYLPQVKATITIMCIGLVHCVIVYADYLAHMYFFELKPGEVPFFYETFGPVRAAYKAILVLAIWSMMLDAIWLRKRLEKLKTARDLLFKES